jgi:hypothetical protein
LKASQNFQLEEASKPKAAGKHIYRSLSTMGTRELEDDNVKLVCTCLSPVLSNLIGVMRARSKIHQVVNLLHHQMYLVNQRLQPEIVTLV